MYCEANFCLRFLETEKAKKKQTLVVADLNDVCFLPSVL